VITRHGCRKPNYATGCRNHIIYKLGSVTLYCSSNSTKSPASGAGNVSEPRLMSHVGRVRVDRCVSAVRAVMVPVLVCLRSSCSHMTEAGGL
jgi:hypothetical protein